MTPFIKFFSVIYKIPFRDLRESLRKFTQFHTHQEFDTLVSNLVKQDELQLRIRELLKYRKNGITRKEECTHFEQQHTRRQLWNKPIVRFQASYLHSPCYVQLH
jgi:hypothetical protein